MSINWHLDVEPRPMLLVLPPAAVSLDEAHAAIELWEFYKRRSLDLPQRLVVEVMMATAEDGTWAAPTTGREMPRQNGKGDEVEVVELWGLVQRAERILHTVHDAVLLATETQTRLLSLIEGHSDLRRLKERAWRGTGQQMIEMRNGGIIWYRTRTGGGARGVDEVDRIVVDEAQHAEEEHLAAITPTQLASANPQLNALGSAGIAGKSVWWWRQRRRALSDAPGNFGYVGHTAEDVKLDGDRVLSCTFDVTDPAVWRRANPALVAGRVSESFFVEQLARLGEALFAREHLGVWDPEIGLVGDFAVITEDDWQGCTDDKSGPLDPVTFGLAVSEDRKWSAIGVAGRSGRGGTHVELTFDQPANVYDYRPGTDWVVERAKAIHSKWKRPFALVKGSPAWSLQPELVAAGVHLIEVPQSEYSQACGAFYDAATQRQIRHLSQPALTIAVSAASKKPSGDLFTWDRRTTVDVSPLEAVTVAKWASDKPDDIPNTGVVDPNDEGDDW